LTCSLVGDVECQIEVKLANTTLAAPVTSTQSRFRYTSIRVGTLYVPKAGEHQLHFRCTKSAGTNALNLLAVTLRPTSEGRPIVQADDGSVTCHARDVTILGVQVQYE